jgi:translation initiation factor 1
MSKGDIVWSSESGDQRKQKVNEKSTPVDESKILLQLRRLTSGKGRTVIEIKGLPSDKDWCLELTRDLKKKCGIGGTYKEATIELHLDNLLKITQLLEKRNLRWKKTGG